MSSFTLETPEMLHAILGSIDEGIHVIDANGYTIYYNQVIAALDGLTEEEVIGQHVLDVFPSLNVHTSTFLQALKKGTPIMNQPQSYVNLKGMRVDTVNSTLPIYVQGTLVGAVEVAKDISKIKELSERLLDLQAQMVASHKAKVPKNRHTQLFTVDQFITRDANMQGAKKAALKVAQSTSPVLVYGETGTGKEIIVQAIHSASSRHDRPFIAQNCAALPANLLESLLYGTTKGSFTGSMDRKGLFEIANGGTLFLDELNSMPVELQAKLLRVLQEGTIRRIGDHKTIPVDVRIIAAMNVDPFEAVRKGDLRSDLFYRIQVVSIHLTPLRERAVDIPLLVEHFIAAFSKEFGRGTIELDSEVLSCMLNYDWPGNARELEHAIEAAMNFAEGNMLRMEHFPEHLQKQWLSNRQSGYHYCIESGEFTSQNTKERLFGTKPKETNERDQGNLGQQEGGRRQHEYELSDEANDQLEAEIPALREVLEREEKRWMIRALTKTEGNIKQAAKLLQIPRQTLQYKLKKYKIDSAGF